MADQDVLKKEPEDSLTQLAKEAMHIPFGLVAKAIDPFFTESTQMTGIENILDETGEMKEGPFLWLVKHEHWYDALQFPAWLLDKGVPDLKIPTKRKFVQHENLSRFINWLMSPLCTGVYRTWLGEGVDSEEELKEMKAANWEMLEELKEEYSKGRHVVFFPEGTTETDGRIPDIKSGAYNVAKIEQEDGTIDLIQCVPVGLTYDFMVGDEILGWKRDLMFFNIGEPFLYGPVERHEGESDRDWVKRDINHFEQRILNYFIDLNTYTVSQLAGEYVVQQAIGGAVRVSLTELDKIVKRRAEALSDIEGIIIDEALLDDESRSKRVARFYEELHELNFINTDGILDHARILAIPEDLDYRDDNILLFSANRLEQIMGRRPAIAEIIEKMR